MRDLKFAESIYLEFWSPGILHRVGSNL